MINQIPGNVFRDRKGISYLESEGQRRRSLLGLIGGEQIQQHAMVEMDFIGMLEPRGVIIGFFLVLLGTDPLWDLSEGVSRLLLLLFKSF